MRSAEPEGGDKATEADGGRPREGPGVIRAMPLDTSADAQSYEQLAMLAAAEARYRGLLEAARTPWWSWTSAARSSCSISRRRSSSATAATSWSASRSRTSSRRVRRAIIADDLRSAADALAQQIGTGIELSGRRKDGSEFPIEIMLAPGERRRDPGDGGDPQHQRAQGGRRPLLQAQKLESIGRLAGGIAHDFNNMLFVINGHAEMLDEDLPGRADSISTGRCAMSSIREAGERAATLTAQLLAFSRQQVIGPKVLDLNAAIAASSRWCEVIGETCGSSSSSTTTPVNPCGCRAARPDPRKTRGQRRDAMPDGGTVTIKTGDVLVDKPYAMGRFDLRPGPYFQLVVSDTGVGMDRAMRERIFEPFFTSKQLGKGTGLGLATAYGIVHQAGGHIWVYSEPGRFDVQALFPRDDPAGTTDRPCRRDPCAWNGHNPRRQG